MLWYIPPNIYNLEFASSWRFERGAWSTLISSALYVTSDIRRLIPVVFIPVSIQSSYFVLPCSYLRDTYIAFFNAMYLSACFFGGGAMSKYESTFLARVRSHLESSLALVDRLGDFIWASVLTGNYLRYTGR